MCGIRGLGSLLWESGRTHKKNFKGAFLCAEAKKLHVKFEKAIVQMCAKHGTRRTVEPSLQGMVRCLSHLHVCENKCANVLKRRCEKEGGTIIAGGLW